MAVGPPLGGSLLAFTLAIAKDVFIYLKHKRRRVIELLDDFQELEGEVNVLLASWNEINHSIDDDPQNNLRRNQLWDTTERKVLRISQKFDKIKRQYEAFSLRPKDGTTEQHNSQGHENDERAQASVETAANEEDNRAIRTQQDQSNECQTRPISALTDTEKQKIWTRNFFKLARLDKDVVKLIPKVSQVKADLVLKKLTNPAKPKIVERKGLRNRGYVMPSQQKHLDDLLQHLSDPDSRRIGICGAPGVGKTYLLENINESFASSSHVSRKFDFIIWIDAPEEGNITETIQEEIIARLKLIKGENKYRNAEIISTALSKKKYLLLIDDFHPLVNLEDIGIYEGHLDVKVVVAAKSYYAMRNLKLNETIEIPTPSLQEAFELFKHNIEGFDALSEQHKDMAFQFLRLFGGLPKVIIFTTNYLNKYRDYQDWKGLKERSQMGILTPEYLGMESLIESYRTVYQSLRGDEFKKCLLYAALFPSRFKISRNTLVECWKAENFLNCHSQLLSVARTQGKLVITELESNMLFESCRNQEYVKMSLFFRKVAFSIRFPNEEEGGMCVRSVLDCDGELDEREWKDVTRLSFIGVENILLPESPKCFNMSTLFLQLNPSLTQIGDKFFTNMRKLRVLDLHGTGIQLLPNSISNLGELRSLYLNDCRYLTHLPRTIVQLKELEILDIIGTLIPCLPAGELISQLVSLRCLRITFPAEIGKPVFEPSSSSKGWKDHFPFFIKTSPNNQTRVVFPPNMHMRLHNLEKVTVGIRGNVTDEIRSIVQGELAGFDRGEEFFDLVECLADSLDLDSKVSEDQQIAELSNAADQTPMPPIHVTQISDALTGPGSNNVASRSVTMPRENKGKEVVEPQTPRKLAKSVSQGGGISINEPQATISDALTDSDDEREGNHSIIGDGPLPKIVGETSSTGGNQNIRGN